VGDALVQPGQRPAARWFSNQTLPPRPLSLQERLTRGPCTRWELGLAAGWGSLAPGRLARLGFGYHSTTGARAAMRARAKDGWRAQFCDEGEAATGRWLRYTIDPNLLTRTLALRPPHPSSLSGSAEMGVRGGRWCAATEGELGVDTGVRVAVEREYQRTLSPGHPQASHVA
jgi:hypothetical protein